MKEKVTRGKQQQDISWGRNVGQTVCIFSFNPHNKLYLHFRFEEKIG